MRLTRFSSHTGGLHNHPEVVVVTRFGPKSAQHHKSCWRGQLGGQGPTCMRAVALDFYKMTVIFLSVGQIREKMKGGAATTVCHACVSPWPSPSRWSDLCWPRTVATTNGAARPLSRAPHPPPPPSPHRHHRRIASPPQPPQCYDAPDAVESPTLSSLRASTGQSSGAIPSSCYVILPPKPVTPYHFWWSMHVELCPPGSRYWHNVRGG
jgi:hypothetical protein